jgi:hypothetical protein
VIDGVPNVLLGLAMLSGGILFLWSLLTWARRAANVLVRARGDLPGKGPDMQVEVDYMQRFPESRFEN